MLAIDDDESAVITRNMYLRQRRGGEKRDYLLFLYVYSEGGTVGVINYERVACCILRWVLLV